MKHFLKLSAVLLALVMILSAITAFSAGLEDYALRGDADHDGAVTILDATKIQRVLVDYDQDEAPWVDVFGDVTGDGLDITDATAIQRKLADFEDPYGIGEEMSGVVEYPSAPPTEKPTSDPYELPPV